MAAAAAREGSEMAATSGAFAFVGGETAGALFVLWKTSWVRDSIGRGRLSESRRARGWLRH